MAKLVFTTKKSFAAGITATYEGDAKDLVSVSDLIASNID